MKKRIYLSGAMGCFEKDDLAPLTWRKTVKEWFKLYHDDKFKVFDPAENAITGTSLIYAYKISSHVPIDLSTRSRLTNTTSAILTALNS